MIIIISLDLDADSSGCPQVGEQQERAALACHLEEKHVLGQAAELPICVY